MSPYLHQALMVEREAVFARQAEQDRLVASARRERQRPHASSRRSRAFARLRIPALRQA